MSAAEIQETKNGLIAWIEEMSDANLLSVLESLKASYTDSDWLDNLTPAQVDNINAGLKEAEGGNLMSSRESWSKLKDA